MFRQRTVIAVVVILVCRTGRGLHDGKERRRPLQTSPIGDSLAQVRQRLEGSWDWWPWKCTRPAASPSG